MSDEFSNILIFNKFLTGEKLGEGSFGKVYSGKNITNQELVAIKLEERDQGMNLLEKEAYNMSQVKGDGIPQLFCYGFNDKYNILVMEILGESIENYFQKCSMKFSLKTVLYLAVQMLERVQYIHEKNLVHRDIKPDNFLTGHNETYKNKIFLIDFGLCVKYRSSKTKEHIPMKIGKTMTGTARYASINSHRGYGQSRRDDLESLGYMLIYFLKSNLPWQGLKAKQAEEKFQRILDKKLLSSIQDLCSDIPQEFAIYLDYCRNLEFSADPDYKFLFSLFYNLMKKEDLDPNLIYFDWHNLNKHEKIKIENFKSGFKITKGIEKNSSLNISNVHEVPGTGINKNPSLVSVIRNKNSGISSKKVSFGKVEVFKEGSKGKSFEERVIVVSTKEITEKSKKPSQKICCLIF